MRTTAVVAVGDNGVIGRDGDLPWSPTGDLAQFKTLTWGHPIVMGRTTFDSIGRPLPGRTSIVLTRDRRWSHEGVVVVRSLAEALQRAGALDDEVFVIGGASVYAEALAAGLLDRLVVTHVRQSPDGDAWFGPIEAGTWRAVRTDPYDGYDIVVYERR